MRVCLAQTNPVIGDLNRNKNKILDIMNHTESELLVFSELTITGYPPKDLLAYKGFLEKINLTIEEISKHNRAGRTVIIGAPFYKKNGSLFNSAFILNGSEKITTVSKTLLPVYDVFDETRYFTPRGINENNIIKTENFYGAVTVCEDLWIYNEKTKRLYSRNPLNEAAEYNPFDYIINISASPFQLDKFPIRLKMLKQTVTDQKKPLFYVNQCGANDELIFDGRSLALDESGNIIHEASAFNEDLIFFDFIRDAENKTVVKKVTENQRFLKNTDDSNEMAKEKKEKKIQSPEKKKSQPLELLEKALITGIQDYFYKSGLKGACIGLSGGIDSAVVTTLAAKALGPENIFPVTMPSEYSSQGSVTDSEALCRNLGLSIEILKINKIYQRALKTLKPVFQDTPFGLAEENLQSRIRGILLMACANKKEYALLATGNKSELAVGYCTLYGDTNGAIMVIGDVPKTKIFELARYINRNREIIPESIISKPPSAELRPDQKDSDSLPDYEILDAIIEKYVEEHLMPDEIIAKGYPKEVVFKTIQLIEKNEYKRFQSPPVLKVCSKAFGSGRRIPLAKKFYKD